MSEVIYNIIDLSIDKGLNAHPAGSAGGYVVLLSAPAEAKVTIQINSNTEPHIPLRPYHAVKATGIEKIYVTCNEVPNSKIVIGQSKTSSDFEMVTPASDVNIDQIGSFQETAIEQLGTVAQTAAHDTHITQYGDDALSQLQAITMQSTVSGFSPLAHNQMNTTAHDTHITDFSEIAVDKMTDALESATLTNHTNQYGTAAIDTLDRIVNKYGQPDHIRSGTSSSTSELVISEFLECDKVRIRLSSISNIPKEDHYGGLTVSLDDGQLIRTVGGLRIAGFANLKDEVIEIEGVRGKTLKIFGFIGGTDHGSLQAFVEMFTLKNIHG